MAISQQQYQQTVEYLFSNLPMFQRQGARAFRKDLTNIRLLCDFLDNPQSKFKTIHVAGTNGKGSTSYMLSAILQAHGLKTGLYVSPHYKDFRERIRINGAYVSRKFVVQFTERIREAVETIQPSFFELAVAMAFEYFYQQKVDVAVIEVGMGGRLDSTNVITPLLSVITNISYDHMEFLGDTLPKIAGEKAGIIKPHIPVVIGETHPETKAVFTDKAAETQSSIIFADQHFTAKISEASLTHTVFDVWKEGVLLYPQLSANLHGDFQEKNLQTVLQAVEALQTHFVLEEAKIRDGLHRLKKLTKFIGRWQVIGENPTIIADSAHNEGGIQLVMNQLLKIPHRKLHFIMGVVNDKDFSKMFKMLPQNATYYFAKADIPRGLDARILKERAAPHGLHGKAYSSVKNAFQAARRQAQPDDLIFVGGSIFVVAEVI
ncbi:MAG: bifunctional folylpolyglutamate synthase/dihydrofolate synthase [Saprospiraceae bacterium]